MTVVVVVSSPDFDDVVLSALVDVVASTVTNLFEATDFVVVVLVDLGLIVLPDAVPEGVLFALSGFEATAFNVVTLRGANLGTGLFVALSVFRLAA